MVSAYWQQVIEEGHRVPPDRPLDELTAELTTMLGDPDPAVREGIALATLGSWISAGVFDELLAGLGAGMCAGLGVGLATPGTDDVFRRSCSALVLAECMDRDTTMRLVSGEVLLGWGDRLSGWFVREQDLRGFVAGKGWAHAVAHGADALAALSRSPCVGAAELTVILDVIADRLLLPSEFWVAGEPDRLAHAVVAVLRRDVLDIKLLEPWVARLASRAVPLSGLAREHPFQVSGNVQAFLRSLQMQLALGKPHPRVRSDLLLVLVDQLIRTNRAYLAPPRQH